jgi:hypothetical protein
MAPPAAARTALSVALAPASPAEAAVTVIPPGWPDERMMTSARPLNAGTEESR